VVGSTTGSRGEIPGERKPVIRDNVCDKSLNPNFFSVYK
jgi:hypothetical protein